jgi:hypothetical protein
VRSQPGQRFSESADPEVRAGNQLADLIREWDEDHPDSPVSVALVHNPRADPPLLGTAPLILSGHVHQRDVTVDDGTGTRIMVEGSTGGAGVTATGISAADEGKPVPLTATLIYLARRGPRAGQVLAYDQVTVGGLGLASISLNRTVVRPDDDEAPGSAPGSSTAPPGTPGPLASSVSSAPSVSSASPAGGAPR